LQLVGLDVVEQLGTGVRLERARRVLLLQAGGQHVLRVTARTTGNRTVDEVQIGVLLLELRDQGVQAGLLTAVRPPGEHLDILGVVAVVPAACCCGERQRDCGQSRDQRSELHGEASSLPFTLDVDGSHVPMPVAIGISPDPRGINRVGNRTVFARPCRSPDSLANSISAAVRPISAGSCATTVIPGRSTSASAKSSNPANAGWFGRTPRPRSTSTVTRLMPQNSAVAGSGLPSTRSTAGRIASAVGGARLVNDSS